MNVVEHNSPTVRPVILVTWIVCLVLAMAPWMTGGREPLALVLSGFALALGSLLAMRQAGGVAALRRGPLLLGYLAIMGWAILSLSWTTNRYSTAMWLVTWLVAGLAFRLSFVVAADRRGRAWLLWAYLAVAVAFCMAGIVMYVTGDYDRLTGPIYWANPAAAFIMPALLVAVWRWLRSESRRMYVLNGSLIGLFGASFWLAGSRAALIIFGFVVVLMILVSQWIHRYWIKIVFAIIIPLLLNTAVMWFDSVVLHNAHKATVNSRLAEVATGTSQSGRDRLNFVGSAFEMWFSHPVLGVGAGSYGDVHPGYQQTVTSASTDAHSVYIQVLAELGLVGAVALAMLILGLLLGAVRGLVDRPEMVPVALGLAALLVHFGVDIDARYPSLMVLAAVLAGMVVRPWSAIQFRPVRWTWPALVGLSLVPIVLLYQSDVAAQRGKLAQSDEDFAAAASYFDQAGSGWLSNPDWISAEGINQLTLAVSGGGEKNTHLAEIDAALMTARRAQAADPYDAQHWQLEGRVQVQRLQLKSAEAAFMRALQLDRLNHPDYALDLAQVQLKLGETTQARQTAQHMLDLYPAAVIENRQADPTLRPQLADLEAVLGDLDLDAGDIQAAGRAADQALKLDSTNLRARALKHQVEVRTLE